MGIFKKRRSGGWSCDTTREDGVRVCRRIELDEKGQRFATGTEIGISTDDHCNPVFSGDVQNIMDDDEGKIEDIAKRMTSQCKKDRGL